MQKVLIFVDSREFESEAVQELASYECEIKKKLLVVGDYVCSDRVVVERKISSDFVQSIIDQRLFTQLKALKENFEKPVMLIEGNGLFGRLHPNAIRGALASVILDYAVPIVWTRDARESAGMIYWLAKREQLEEKREVAVRGEKREMGLKEQQEFLVAGLPGISSVRARALLKHFRTPEKVFAASIEELMEVEGVGKATAERIREVLAGKARG